MEFLKNGIPFFVFVKLSSKSSSADSMHYQAPQFSSRRSFFKLFVASEDSTPSFDTLSIAEQRGHFPMYPEFVGYI